MSAELSSSGRTESLAHAWGERLLVKGVDVENARFRKCLLQGLLCSR